MGWRIGLFPFVAQQVGSLTNSSRPEKFGQVRSPSAQKKSQQTSSGLKDSSFKSLF